MDPKDALIRRPLYRQLAAKIRHDLRDKRPGERIATEAELRQRFGVSLVTVRQALRELEDEGLLVRRHGSGTFLPESRIPRRHVALLLDADPTHPRLSPYFPKVMQELRVALHERGLANRTYHGFGLPANGHGHGPLSSRELLDDTRLGRVHGLIGFLTQRDPSWVELMQAHKVPVLDLEFKWQHGWLRKTGFIHAALAHLQRAGKRRLAVLGSENPRHPILAAFYRELAEAAAQYGIVPDERCVDLTASAWEVGMGWERLRDLWRQRRADTAPDSLLIFSDRLFADCQMAIMELGLAPALEIVVSSSDAVDLQPLFPVHAYRINTRAAAGRHAEAISAMLKGEPLPAGEASPEAKLVLLRPGETAPAAVPVL
ncbi:MAG TPA: GntR family transcriptional regulator [Chthoniobacteraceae bacterium]|nr:GntR family transcriptional regulator [Chthoniobacteraceae bacterium]